MTKRQAWVVVYERKGGNMPTLRELYWSKEAAEDRALSLTPECREILVGFMEWYLDPASPVGGE